jgi:hypothetical protein
MSVAKVRCHVVRTIAESQDQIEEFWMVEFGEAYGTLQHVSEARREPDSESLTEAHCVQKVLVEKNDAGRKGNPGAAATCVSICYSNCLFLGVEG